MVVYNCYIVHQPPPDLCVHNQRDEMQGWIRQRVRHLFGAAMGFEEFISGRPSTKHIPPPALLLRPLLLHTTPLLLLNKAYLTWDSSWTLAQDEASRTQRSVKASVRRIPLYE